MSVAIPSAWESELAVLRTLLWLAGATGSAKSLAVGTEVATALDQLAGRSWSDDEHRVVYECLRAAIRKTAIGLREQMAADATRLGHPEIDWTLYFHASPIVADLAALIRNLKQTRFG